LVAESGISLEQAIPEGGGLGALAFRGDEGHEVRILWRKIEKGLLCGSDAFAAKLGSQAGQSLEYRPLGRSKKNDDDA